jgi:hypothetical protein
VVTAPRVIFRSHLICASPSKQKKTFSSYLVNFASVVEFDKFHCTYNGLHAYCMWKHRGDVRKLRRVKL